MTDGYRHSARPPRKEVVVATFDTPHEAELARVFLSSRNIEASLKDDTLIGMAQLYSTALGGVKLLTDVEQAEEATKILERYRKRGRKKRRKKRASEDEVARRSFRTALIGIFICPGALHLYTLYLLADMDRTRLTASGKRNANAALLVSVAMVVLIAGALFNSC